MSDLHLWHRNELNKLRRDMAELFDCLVRDFCNPFDMRMLRETPELRVEAGTDVIVVTARVPRLDPSSLRLSVQGRRLFISGEKIDADEGLRVVSRHSFSSTVILPCPVDMDRAEAGFDNGLLRIRLPKYPAADRLGTSGARTHTTRGRNE